MRVTLLLTLLLPSIIVAEGTSNPPSDTALDLREDILVLREKLLEGERLDTIMLLMQIMNVASDMKEMVATLRSLEEKLEKQAGLVDVLTEKLDGIQQVSASLRESERINGDQLNKINNKVDVKIINLRTILKIVILMTKGNTLVDVTFRQLLMSSSD